MAALLKDVYNLQYMTHLADCVQDHYSDFNKTAFLNAIFDTDWQNKELKARTTHIAVQLNAYIAFDYLATLAVIEKIAPHFTSYQGMFVPAFVEIYGLDYLPESIAALSYITQFSSAEFAVRPFIVKYPQAMHSILLQWSVSDNEHIRRLSSEGARPRLPWAMALPEFKKDPAYLLPILENLKADPSEYVRRSVANNLNDIAKDHPQLVTDIAARWLVENKTIQTKRLVKHACRSLLKQADPSALALFGFLPPKDVEVNEFDCDQQVRLGELLHFSFALQHKRNSTLDKLRIEFAIDFMKSNGKQARKIFQLSESMINQNNKTFTKSFNFKAISTRKYYCGLHRLAIVVNGVELSRRDFTLVA